MIKNSFNAITYDNVPVNEFSIGPNEEMFQHDDPMLYLNLKRDTYQHQMYPKQSQTPLIQPNIDYIA